MTNRLSQILIYSVLLGATMPLFAGSVHPKGPEDRPFTQRTLTFHGKTRDCMLTISYPKPDDLGDRVGNGYYVTEKWDSPFGLHYEYRGRFSRLFATLSFSLIIDPRRPESPPWKDMESLLRGVQIERIARNEKTKNNPLEMRQQWQEPSKSELNGIPCIKQYVYRGDDPQGECLYYFLIDEDHALLISIYFVNNNTPGTPESDWRPRAEAFAGRILETVRIRWESGKQEPEGAPSTKLSKK